MTSEDSQAQMNTIHGVYVLNELFGREIEFDGWVYCPGCGTDTCVLGWNGEMTDFRRGCEQCGGVLTKFSAVVASRNYIRDHGTPAPPEMRHYLTGYWDQILSDGVVGENIDYELAGVMQNGEYSPHVVPRVEEVDQTEKFSRIFTKHAHNFGWEWEPDGRTRED